MGSRKCRGAAGRLAIMSGALSISAVAAMSFALAQTQYDGIYAGTQTLIENGSTHNYSQCLKGPFKRTMVIKGGAVTYTYNPTYQGQVTGTVTADGDVTASASTSSGAVSLSGKIQGGEFTGEVWSIICTYSLNLKRAP